MENDEFIEMKRKGKEFMASFQGRPFLYGIGIFLLILLLLKAVVTIPAGYVGVKDFFGRVYDETLPAGFHIINPLLKIHNMDIRTQEVSEETNVPSKEGLTVSLDVTLLSSLDPAKAADVYKTIGSNYRNVVVIPQLRSIVRGVTSGYEAKSLFLNGRGQNGGKGGTAQQHFFNTNASCFQKGLELVKHFVGNHLTPGGIKRLGLIT